MSQLVRSISVALIPHVFHEFDIVIDKPLNPFSVSDKIFGENRDTNTHTHTHAHTHTHTHTQVKKIQMKRKMNSNNN